MSTNAAEVGATRGPWAASWHRFWFTPGDPTVLALIRICTGLMAVYVHLVYAVDFDEMLGKDGWVDLTTRQQIYRNAPVAPTPLGWGSYPFAPPPQTEQELAYWKAYVARWGKPPPGPYPRTDAEDQQIEEYHAFWGQDPRALYARGKSVFSVWLHVTDPTAARILVYLFVAIVFLFLIGFCTRLTAPLTLFATLCYSHREHSGLFGVDTMLVILLLYLSIGPSGAVLSADRALARWWARVRPRAVARWHALWGRDVPAGPPSELGPVQPSVSANIAVRLLQIHLCIVYLFAGLSKLQGPMWWNGTAVWGVIANYEMAPMQYDWYVSFLRLLVANRAVFEVLMSGAVLFTLAFEIGYAFLIWRPATRWLFLTGAVVLHGFIGMFMGLRSFSLIMLTMNLVFVPPEMAKRWLSKLPFYREPESPVEAAPAR